jgi:hypothetical protein
VLTAAEIALLVGKCSIDLPPGFATGEVDASALRQAASALATRGVVVESDDLLDCRPVPSIAVNLAVLASPVVTVGSKFRSTVVGCGRFTRCLGRLVRACSASRMARSNYRCSRPKH